MRSNYYNITDLEAHLKLLCDSYQIHTNNPLIVVDNEQTLSECLSNAPFALLSHGTEKDPIFNYGNQMALKLFEMSADELIQLPSRKSAESITQEERNQLMSEVTANGYISNYQGMRISSTGKRFRITQAVVWNIIDSKNNYFGQAAKLDKWEMLD